MTLKFISARRRALGGAVVAPAALVASCGGGEMVSTFHASRVLAFGDESSLIVDRNNDGNGSKYSVNAVQDDAGLVNLCTSNPVWVQSVANSYGLVFPECNPGPTPVDSPTSRIRATLGARAADISAQIGVQQAESPIRAGDIATVYVGVNDIIAEYQQYPTISEAQIALNLDAAGAETGRQVNRLADLGAKVLIATVPDLRDTPFAIAETVSHADTDRAALLSRLSLRYNASLRMTLNNDGRRIGLVLLDELISAVFAFPGLDGFTNATDGVCNLDLSMLTPPSILDCTSLTLVTNGSAAYLWADDRHLSASGQTTFGNLAVSREQTNPF